MKKARVNSKVSFGGRVILTLKTDDGKISVFAIPTGRIQMSEVKKFSNKLIKFLRRGDD